MQKNSSVGPARRFSLCFVCLLCLLESGIDVERIRAWHCSSISCHLILFVSCFPVSALTERITHWLISYLLTWRDAITMLSRYLRAYCLRQWQKITSCWGHITCNNNIQYLKRVIPRLEPFLLVSEETGKRNMSSWLIVSCSIDLTGSLSFSLSPFPWTSDCTMWSSFLFVSLFHAYGTCIRRRRADFQRSRWKYGGSWTLPSYLARRSSIESCWGLRWAGALC